MTGARIAGDFRLSGVVPRQSGRAIFKAPHKQERYATHQSLHRPPMPNPPQSFQKKIIFNGYLMAGSGRFQHATEIRTAGEIKGRIVAEVEDCAAMHCLAEPVRMPVAKDSAQPMVLADRPNGRRISAVILPFTRVRLHSPAKGHLLP